MAKLEKIGLIKRLFTELMENVLEDFINKEYWDSIKGILIGRCLGL